MVSSLKTINNKKYKHEYTHNPMVKGNFPKHEKNLSELSLFMLNRFLSFSLVIAVFLTMISYFLVVSKEKAVISVHNSTNEINMQNIELQNQVEQAKSYYNINHKVSQVDFLKKPDKVLEVKALAQASQKKKVIERLEIKPVSGF